MTFWHEQVLLWLYVAGVFWHSDFECESSAFYAMPQQNLIDNAISNCCKVLQWQKKDTSTFRFLKHIKKSYLPDF